jgi:hypothetical protein
MLKVWGYLNQWFTHMNSCPRPTFTFERETQNSLEPQKFNASPLFFLNGWAQWTHNQHKTLKVSAYLAQWFVHMITCSSDANIHEGKTKTTKTQTKFNASPLFFSSSWAQCTHNKHAILKVSAYSTHWFAHIFPCPSRPTFTRKKTKPAETQKFQCFCLVFFLVTGLNGPTLSNESWKFQPKWQNGSLTWSLVLPRSTFTREGQNTLSQQKIQCFGLTFFQ